MGTLAIITIGQSPRTDLTPEIAAVVPAGTVLLECGALDGLTEVEVKALGPTQGDQVLTSRMRDGTAVTLGRQPLIARLQMLISRVEKEADVVMLACTGEFPAFEHTTPLVEPDVSIVGAVQATVSAFGTVGIICPLAAQLEISANKFAASLPRTVRTVVAAATPYTTDLTPLEAAAEHLRTNGANFIVLDCMGYTQEMGEMVGRISGLPVLLSRTVAAQVAREYLAAQN